MSIVCGRDERPKLNKMCTMVRWWRDAADLRRRPFCGMNRPDTKYDCTFSQLAGRGMLAAT
jgi:hypothetical protein